MVRSKRSGNPILEAQRSKYIGKRVEGVRYGRIRGERTMIPGFCESAYYTVNGPYRNIHYRIRTDDGRLLSFNVVRTA